MDCFAEAFVIMRSVTLGDHHRRAGGEPCAESHDCVDDRAGRPYRCLRLFSDELAHDQRIHGIVQLLEQEADRHRNREADHMHPDIALGHIRVHPCRKTASFRVCVQIWYHNRFFFHRYITPKISRIG